MISSFSGVNCLRSVVDFPEKLCYFWRFSLKNVPALRGFLIFIEKLSDPRKKIPFFPGNFQDFKEKFPDFRWKIFRFPKKSFLTSGSYRLETLASPWIRLGKVRIFSVIWKQIKLSHLSSKIPLSQVTILKAEIPDFKIKFSNSNTIDQIMN